MIKGTGAAVCVANLIAKTTAVGITSRSVVLSWAKEVMTISYMQYVPVDTGALRNSGKVEVSKSSITEFYVRMSYGEGLDYAIYVHEIPRHHNHGQYKFLSAPFNLMSSRLMSDLQSKCGAVL